MGTIRTTNEVAQKGLETNKTTEQSWAARKKPKREEREMRENRTGMEGKKKLV